MTPKNKYFKVTAKCGHVGKGNYVPVAFAVKAESRSAASQKVMTYHRVKKQLNDAIISCEEIDRVSSAAQLIDCSSIFHRFGWFDFASFFSVFVFADE